MATRRHISCCLSQIGTSLLLSMVPAAGQTMVITPYSYVINEKVQFSSAKHLDYVDQAKRLSPSWLPHPWISFGAQIMPPGYSRVAFYGTGGVDIMGRYLSFDGTGTYDNGHKVDDGTGQNPKGHDRYLSTTFAFRPPTVQNWALTAGYSWSQLSTSNYYKGGRRPFFGFTHDFLWSTKDQDQVREGLSGTFSLRWVMSGTDWENGVHGTDFSLTFPRTNNVRHTFFTWDLGVYRFHETVTEVANTQLSAAQRAHREFYETNSMGVVFRFR